MPPWCWTCKRNNDGLFILLDAAGELRPIRLRAGVGPNRRNLRHGGPYENLGDRMPTTAFHHFLLDVLSSHIDFCVRDTFGVQQLLRTMAVRAGNGCIHRDFTHEEYFSFRLLLGSGFFKRACTVQVLECS